MTYKLLDVDTQWPLVRHEFESRNVPMPSPQFAMIMGAFNDDDLFTGSFAVIQFKIHLEPVVSYDPSTTPQLIHAAEQEIESKFGQGVEYFTHANDRVGRLAEAMGCEKLPLNVYRKIVI